MISIRHGIAAVALFAAVTASATTVYLKADATGTGDGTSWANACTDIHTAVGLLTADSDEAQVIYAAQGVYTVSSTITAVKNFEIYGGFKGDETGTKDQMLAARDWDAYQTILTGDKNGDDTWVHIIPDKTDLAAPQYVATDEPVIKDGRVNLPAYTGDYDAYVIALPSSGTYTTRCFDVPAHCGTTIFDGIWVTSFCGGRGTFVNDSENAFNKVSASLYVRNCRAVGHRTAGSTTFSGVIFNYANRTLNQVLDCRVVNCSQDGPMPMYGGFQAKGCAFVGITAMAWNSTTGAGGSPLGIGNWNGGTTEGCTFTHCVCYSSSSARFFASADLINFTFTNNFCVSTSASGCPFVTVGDSYASNCCFRANFVALTGVAAGKSYAFLLCKNASDWNASGCGYSTFADNEIVVKLAASPGEGEYTYGMIAHDASGIRPMMVFGCSFLKNRLSVESNDAVTGYASEAIVQEGLLSTSKPAEIGMANCTVWSCGDAGVYGVVQTGDNLQQTLEIVNCIFMSDADRPEPFRLTRSDIVDLRHCAVKNMINPPSGVSAVGWTYDEIPLERFTFLSGIVGQTCCRIAALPPGISVASDVYPYCRFYDRKSAGALNYKYRDPGESDWTKFSPVYAAYGGDANGAPTLPLAPATDVEGKANAFGSYNRGAVQTPTALATSGHTLTLRRDPLNGGTITGGAAVRAVADGGSATATVTAASGKTFDGWYDGDTLYSSSATLTVPSLTSDLVLTAKFSAPKVALTFDLGVYATFEGGSSTYVTNVYPGSIFPTIPAYTENAGWHTLGWDKTLPAEVPETATTYAMTGVTTAMRRIYLVPAEEASGTSDGTGWETAHTSFAAAYADAAKYRGEIWAKKGSYVISAQIVPKSNISVYGGFNGTEESRDAADPVANPTVIRGATPILFNNAEGQVTNAVFAGLVVSNFTQAAFAFASSLKSDLAVRDCVFTHNGIALSLENAVLEARDCVFRRNGRALAADMSADYAAEDARCTLSGCTFERNSAADVPSVVALSGRMHAVVTNCLFAGNRASAGYGSSMANASALELSCWNTGRANGVFDCTFRTNTVTCNGRYTVYASTAATFARCLFDGNCAEANVEGIVSWAGGARTAGICAGGGEVLVRDCVFTNQVLNANIGDLYGGYQGSDVTWSAIVTAAGGSLTLLNCSIEDSFVANNSAAVPNGTVTIGAIMRYGGANLALVNCQMLGSVITNLYSAQIAQRGGSGTFALIDTVIGEPTLKDSGAAWRTNGANRVYACFADSHLYGIDLGDFETTADNAFVQNLLTEPPVWFPTRRTDARTGLSMPHLRGPAPYLKARGVYMKDGAVWYRDAETDPAKPWRKATARATFAAEGDPSAPSLADGQVPDAFNMPRRGRHAAVGPLVGPKLGLLVTVY